MSVQVSYKKQFTLGILFLLIILSAVEGVIRIDEYLSPACKFLENEIFKEMEQSIANQICIDNNQVLKTKVPVLFHHPNQHYVTININDYGFRGPEIIKENHDTFRIFVVGGSTTFGAGSTSDQTTISGYLQNFFTINYPELNVEVINAGVGSATSTTELSLVKNILIDFKPDMIVIYDGWNDAVHRPVFVYDNDEKNTENTAQLIQSELEKIFLQQYRTPVFIYYKMFNDPQLKFNFPNLDSVTDFQTVTKWKENLLEICELGVKNDFDSVIVVQPIIGSGNKSLTENEQEYAPINERTLGTVGTIRAMADSLSEMDSICTHTADFTQIFNDVEGPIFFDQGHMSDSGNKIIAENLYQEILPIIHSKN